MNVFTLFELPAEIMPNADCVNDGTPWTYTRVMDSSTAIAGWLSQQSLQRGDTIAFVQEISAFHVAAMFGALQAGLIIAPLNFRFRASEMTVALKAVKPKLVLVDERYLDVVNDAVSKLAEPIGVANADEMRSVLSSDPISPAWRSAPATDVDPTDTAVILLTSGTTGAPKPIIMKHGDLFSDTVRRMQPPTGQSRGENLLAVPTYHVAGLAHIFSSVYSGRTVRIMKQFDADLWLDICSRERVKFAFVVPTMLKRILDSPRFDGSDLSSLEILSYGAAPTPPQLIKRAVECFPATCELVNAYGMTETRGTVTILTPEDHRRAREGPDRELAIARLASVGRAVPGVTVTVMSEIGEQVLPAGSTGEIVITREETSERRRTGDFGYLDEEGYLYLVGRSSDRIIRGGENVDPVEIENVIDSFPGVDESAVVGQHDDEWGEKVTAVVVLQKGSEIDLDELAKYARTKLASFKCPSSYVLFENLPRNALGKITRNVLRERLANNNE